MRKIEICIYSPTSYTDKSIMQFMERNEKYLFEEYSLIFNNNIYNEKAEKIIRFFSEYDYGFFCPQKCDAYEPIREIFNPKKIKDPIRWLSQPGSAFYFKKRKNNIEGVIENNDFPPVWRDGELIKSKIKLPYFRSYIKLSIDEKVFKIKGIDYWYKLFEDLSLEIRVFYAFADYSENIREKELIRLSKIEDFNTHIYKMNYFNKEFMKLASINLDSFNHLKESNSLFAIAFVDESAF